MVTKFRALVNIEASMLLASKFRDISAVKDIQTWKWILHWANAYESDGFRK